jgi:hypothetical protein
MTETPDPTPAARPRQLRMPFGRRGLLLSAFAVISLGAVLNWDWLTAIGAAPLILAVAPCAAMCVAGVCMMGGSKSCANKSDPASRPDLTRD